MISDNCEHVKTKKTTNFDDDDDDDDGDGDGDGDDATQ